MKPSSSDTSGSGMLEVGRVGKAHGLAGDVVVTFSTDRLEERTAVGSCLAVEGRQLEVAAARLHQGKWLVRFAGIAGRNEAEELRGKLLFADPLDDPDALFVHNLIGKSVVDDKGANHGEVTAVVANPASDLLELANGSLIPLHFFVSSDDKHIKVNVPPGLLDEADS